MTDHPDLRAACTVVAALAKVHAVSVSDVVDLLYAAFRTGEQLPEFVAAYENGATVAELARAEGVTPTSMYQRLRKAGAQMRRKGPRGPRSPRDPARAQAMADMYASGATLEQVGAHYGVSRERVRQILERLGVASRSTSHPDYAAKRRATYAAAKTAVVTAYDAGEPIADIAAARGVKVPSIKLVLRRADRRVPNKLQQEQAARLARALELFDAGMSIAEIAARTTYKSEASCRAVLHRYGRTIRTRPTG